MFSHVVIIVLKCNSVLCILIYADKTNLARFNVSSPSSKAHPVYMSLANLPAHLRESDGGSEVLGLMPIYSKFALPALSKDDHADNAKVLYWSSYSRMLAPLIPGTENADQFCDGFRFAAYLTRLRLVGPFTTTRIACKALQFLLHHHTCPQVCWRNGHHV